jgi:hypothetical protein
VLREGWGEGGVLLKLRGQFNCDSYQSNITSTVHIELNTLFSKTAHCTGMHYLPVFSALCVCVCERERERGLKCYDGAENCMVRNVIICNLEWVISGSDLETGTRYPDHDFS